MSKLRVVLGFLILGVGVLWVDLVYAADPLDTRRNANIKATTHNLSTSGTGSLSGGPVVQSDTLANNGTSEICVFCHTPHAATLDAEVAAPLWNRQFSSGDYSGKMYTSESFDARTADADGGLGLIDASPGGSSKLCLSCHDGTLAIGAVNVLEGETRGTSNPIAMLNTTAGKMPAGADGYTRNLGTDLTNDHPISFKFNNLLAASDGELSYPEADPQVGVRGDGEPRFILEGTLADKASAKVQCTTCHDPHLQGINEDASVNIKFLRGNRFQRTLGPAHAGGVDAPFNEELDIFCLGCHRKAGWAISAHAHKEVANEQYRAADAATRDFPAGIKVFEAGCLNCHDTHTKTGSRRLLREGSEVIGANTVPAIEQTCYQCHALNGGILDPAVGVFDVPDIKTDFERTYRMPIKTVDQEPSGNSVEPHKIRDKDFVEKQSDLDIRHVECTDCHNPHRVKKSTTLDDYTADGSDGQGTHLHSSATEHNNIASGVLTGAVGVEPTYASTLFTADPVNWAAEITFPITATAATALKKGVPVGTVTTADLPSTKGFVTREYQVCLKCHSNYAFGSNPPPLLGRTAKNSGSSSGQNGVTQVTNQAMEFQAPSSHKGEYLDSTSPADTTGNWGVGAAYQDGNHRSWHPVMGPTGRTTTIRSAAATQWQQPFRNVGTQTMYCSDCHGSNTVNGTSAPADPAPWGPHGSTNPFILKGTWNTTVLPTATDALCFRCHSTNYRSGTGDTNSGFEGGGKGDLHDYHVNRIERDLRCTWCHVALPHGWKNKAFLVNLNDIGDECSDGVVTGEAAGTWSFSNRRFTCAPYYQNAALRVNSFSQSGNWSASDCGTSTNNDKGWMQSVCDKATTN